MIGKKKNYFKIRNIGTFKNANFVGDEDLMEKLLEFFFYQDVISSTNFRSHSSSNIDLNIYSTYLKVGLIWEFGNKFYNE